MYYPSYPQSQMMYRNGDGSSSNIMNVTGVGTISVEPNVAKINIGVVTQDKELTNAQQANAQTLNQVIQSLEQQGIPSKDIQTVEYYIYPQYDYVDGKQEFRGYEVTHMIQVTVRDLNQTGQIIDMAVRNGANRISNIAFTLDDPKQYYQKALSMALEDAEAKAQNIAYTMRLNLNPTPVEITEVLKDPQGSPQMLMKAEAVSSTSSTTVEPGQLTIVARVQTQFQYTSY